MKRADIKPGEIYAYRRSENYSLQQVKFLTLLDKDHLYTKPYRKSTFVLATKETKPHASSIYADTGWLVALGRDVSEASLDDALTVGETWRGDGQKFQYTILVTTNQVIGTYEEVHAAEVAERAARDAAEKERRVAETARENRMNRLMNRFGSQGIDLYRAHSNLWRFEMTIETAQAIIEKLEGK